MAAIYKEGSYFSDILHSNFISHNPLKGRDGYK